MEYIDNSNYLYSRYTSASTGIEVIEYLNGSATIVGSTSGEKNSFDSKGTWLLNRNDRFSFRAGFDVIEQPGAVYITDSAVDSSLRGATNMGFWANDAEIFIEGFRVYAPEKTVNP
jgi:hypothetical protein